MIKLLEDLQATSSDPDRVLKRCEELAPLVKGTVYEDKVREIRRRAQESGFVVDPGRRIDLALAEAKKLQDLDPRFERRSEVKSLLEKARDSAGARRSEIDQALALYDKKYDDAARVAQDRAKEEAERLATSSRFREAADRLTEYPAPFRGTRYGESLAALREDYLRRTSEADRQVSDRVMGPWKDWKIADCMGSPVFIEASEGRSYILQTHPASPDLPASLERTLDIPKGQNLLSFWVSYLKDGDWELRVVIDGKRVMADTIGGFEPRWKEVQVDLAPYAGRQIALRLENAANGWYWEQALWNDLSIRPGTPAQWEARRKREKEIWSPWKVSSSPGAGMPVTLDSHDGRSQVLRTHPFAKDKPALLERDFAIPSGKKAEFSVWVNHLRAAEWELRIVAGDTLLLRETLSGNPGWKKVSVDLSPYAGKRVALRLENGAASWNHDYAYWSDPELQIR
jgi:hypothetical protein